MEIIAQPNSDRAKRFKTIIAQAHRVHGASKAMPPLPTHWRR